MSTRDRGAVAYKALLEAMQHQRDSFICFAVAEGISRAKLADEFGLTRQRIDQIVRNGQ